MLTHLSLAVSDIDKAAAFYDAALAPIGASRLMSIARGDIRICGHGRDGKPSFWIAGVISRRGWGASADIPGSANEWLPSVVCSRRVS